MTQTLVYYIRLHHHINHKYSLVNLQDLQENSALNRIGLWHKYSFFLTYGDDSLTNWATQPGQDTNTLDKDLLQTDFYLVTKYGK